MSFSTTSTLLWLQFAYAVWQFVREAKFFRIPAALVYHTILWLTRRPGYGRPFSKVDFSVVVQGMKWTARTSQVLRSEDVVLGGGHYLQERNGSKYIIDNNSLAYTHMIDRRGIQILCSNVDIILPDFYIADCYSWSEGFDKYLMDGAKEEHYSNGRALFTSSREHFLNQNFMRLLSILPLVLQAKGLDTLSIYASGTVIALDQLSYPANLLWIQLQDVLVGFTRGLISRIEDTKKRRFISTFLSTVTPRLKYRDQVYRNFYYVKRHEEILIFGTSCVDYFHDDLKVMDPPAQLNEFMELGREDYDSLSLVNGDMEGGFGITVGNPYVEHHVNGAKIKSFFMRGESFFNFIDNEHLHYGFCREDQVTRMRIALKWIENNGKMPVTCDYSGDLKAVEFNSFVDKVGGGYSPIYARVKKGRWVQ